MPFITSLATAVPRHRLTQSEAKELARTLFGDGLAETPRLLNVFDNAKVGERYVCVPPEWFRTPHTFEEKNGEYVRSTLQLGATAIQACLDRAGLEPDEIDAFIFVSSSGLATPTLDTHLINGMGFSPSTRRIPIFGLGCVGGAAGLGHACQLVSGRPGSRALLLVVELNSITFQENDFSPANLVASSLFADGAAAAVVSAESDGRAGFEVLDATSHLWPDSTDLMGWNFTSTGFQVVFSRRIPALIRRHMATSVQNLLKPHGLQQKDLSHFLLHPGGARILDAYEQSLGLNGSSLDHSRHILNYYGNMSSATLLFILERASRVSVPAGGDYILGAAFGPGFSSEMLLLRWRS